MRWRRWLLALILGLAALAAAQDASRVQRRLADLVLGDSLATIQKLYPPTQQWPSHIESRQQVTRYRVERSYTKTPAKGVDVMWLGLKNDRLVEIQLIYDGQATRGKPVESMADEISLLYGQPHTSGGRHWWTDRKTVLRVFNAELPVLRDGQKAIELRASLQLMDASLFH